MRTNKNKKHILLTGAAGFIGYKTAVLLLSKGFSVIGIDNLNDYYDVRLKRYRLDLLKGYPNFHFIKMDIENNRQLKKIFGSYSFNAVINLAARAGVRYSMLHPHVYVTTNTLGTLNLLELCQQHKVPKFVLASTSSLYAGQPMPFSEESSVNTPISPYAASKKGAEALCYAYHYLYGIDVSVVRYFTVYGPAGRPDMSCFRFIEAIDAGKAIDLYGDGTQQRDFTYVDDIANGTVLALKRVGYEVFNLGNNRPQPLTDMIRHIEECLGKKVKIKRYKAHKADVAATWADINKARRILGWKPAVSLKEGISRTVAWHKSNKLFLSKVKAS